MTKHHYESFLNHRINQFNLKYVVSITGCKYSATPMFDSSCQTVGSNCQLLGCYNHSILITYKQIKHTVTMLQYVQTIVCSQIYKLTS